MILESLGDDDVEGSVPAEDYDYDYDHNGWGDQPLSTAAPTTGDPNGCPRTDVKQICSNVPGETNSHDDDLPRILVQRAV